MSREQYKNNNVVLDKYDTNNYYPWNVHTFYLQAWFAFITSEIELDNYQQKINVRVVSKDAERLKTYGLRKLGNLKITTEVEHLAVYPKTITLITALKSWKRSFKLSIGISIVLDFVNFGQIVTVWVQQQKTYLHTTSGWF